MARKEIDARTYRPFLDITVPVDGTRSREIQYTVSPGRQFQEDRSGMLVINQEPLVDRQIFIEETSVISPEVPNGGYLLRTWRSPDRELLDFHVELYPALDPVTMKGLKKHFMNMPLEQRDLAMRRIQKFLFPECVIDEKEGLRFVSGETVLDVGMEGNLEDTHGKWRGDETFRYKTQLEKKPYTIETGHMYSVMPRKGDTAFESVQYKRGLQLTTLDPDEIKEFTRLAISDANVLDEVALREMVNPYVQFIVGRNES